MFVPPTVLPLLSKSTMSSIHEEMTTWGYGDDQALQNDVALLAKDPRPVWVNWKKRRHNSEQNSVDRWMLRSRQVERTQ